MLIKTKDFEKKLNSKLYQYTFNRKFPLSLKGSFHHTTYISDIDFTAYVHFNQKFIEILISKLKKLADFKFIYLNAGIDKNFNTPWVINPEWGCNFDITTAIKWFKSFKEKKLIPQSEYDEIEKIITKKELILGDLVDIQEILGRYNTIRWFLPDIEKGIKNIHGHTYNLLDELKSEQGAVLNSIYIDGKNIISVDIGLVDKKYRQPIWSRMYKYYTKNWYQILKSYKKLIGKDYEKEYRDIMGKLQYDNALLAQVKLLNSLMKYKVVDQEKINYVALDLKQHLEKKDILSTDLKYIVKKLETQLNKNSKPYVDYFLDKLTHEGKIKAYIRLRLTKISQIPTSIKKLKTRREGGNMCPFFEDDETEFVNTLAQKLLMNNKKLHECLRKFAGQINTYKFTQEVFRESPVSRLFLQYKNDKKDLYVRGSLTRDDRTLFTRLGKDEKTYFVFNPKHEKRLQIYLVTGY